MVDGLLKIYAEVVQQCDFAASRPATLLHDMKVRAFHPEFVRVSIGDSAMASYYAARTGAMAMDAR
jgi:hypothetical protein